MSTLKPVLVMLAAIAIFASAQTKSDDPKPADRSPTIDEVIEARTDILGDSGLRQPDGPSYEFFAEAMPPLRYVNAAFRHYPIVLAAPRNECKARLVSNGSAINAKGGGNA
ncbi:MAG: hypothetical protein WC655_15530 [Candidatus Hydrogenedentales bacterium]|jgi:hypothetical protein